MRNLINRERAGERSMAMLTSAIAAVAAVAAGAFAIGVLAIRRLAVHHIDVGHARSSLSRFKTSSCTDSAWMK